ncbi:MAG TPA: hydrogenase maturation nickel metallochaperone HypA [Clostridia bacterium]|nr:hydrogenase maturation nickel metallochaperone HypA [Clostridia bacterium]
MHELSIATSILETVEAEAAKRPGSRFVKLGLRIGELAGIDPDALTFGWEALTRDTEFANLALAIEGTPWKNRCPVCASEFVVKDYQSQCPACGEANTRCIGGEELDIAYIEVDEP